MTDKSVWDKEIPVPASLIAYVDDAVIAKLPPGTTPTDIAPSGASYWARTAKISATDADGNETAFFMKVHHGDHGKNMVSNEYQSMAILYKAMPELVAEPLGWGSYQDDPEAYFFLCRFHEMSDDVPDAAEFTELIAKMHKDNPSPTGQFGFPLVTYGGRNPQFFPVTKSWEECFSTGLKMIFDLEEQTQGPDEELAVLRKGFFELVIPRLLRPLETEGRTLTPRLVHGDLWDGNTSVDVNTGKLMIFDATPLYAHNEYEMGPWWCSRHKMTDQYINEYIKHFQMTDPVEDFNDRGLIYNL
ncbi:Fructosamine/Ketosamine-3-kinase [Phialemonium atrogriseum]|uniref:protein-ribulosamine 3-kinase n=1 Tax=Phialemonium atrogriseum TaxID=1093897 RepID=A0AAJ0FFH5_9PEZI|nr:Fructosamine/Ketosamine-3-kinase [Phialemonium atrogriseum]KAK1765477.1 Fructosamine/Ketosamine-3-kinase [Phialemonium atrogriseum]